MIDKDMLEMAREAKAARDADGNTDERADAALSLYEMGIGNFGGRDPREILADPASHQGKALPVIPANGDDGAPRVRRGGEAASNQFGTFTVHTASAAQVRFIKRLVAERDLGDVKIPTEVESISKTAASALIDRLNARPAKTGAPAATGAKRATEKQMAFLRRLIAERDYHSLLPTDRAKVDALNANPNAVPTAKGASDLIDVLTKTAYATTKSADRDDTGAELELGMYRKADGTLYRVYPGRESGRLLAKRLVMVEDYDFTVHGKKAASFEYAGMASRFVNASERMSLEEAKAFGHQFGICCVCGALLTDPESVANGIGPVCSSRI